MNHPKYKRYIITRFPNFYKRHYEAHVKDGNLQERKRIVRIKLQRMEDFNLQDPSTLELLADYLLAEDHLRGLSLKREANEIAQDNEEYPPLGEGAQEFHQREWIVGDVITIGECRKVKVCEICRCKFIDRSRAFNARVCGQTCRERKDALRKRADYNQSELGIKNETRLKRYRVRQDHEYPFYSPQELYELSVRSEQVLGDDKLERKAYKHGEATELENGPRFQGKRKPMWVSDKFGELSDKSYNFQPKGRSRFIDTEEEKNGPVIVRKISVDVTEAQLEAEKWANANKMRGLGVMIPRNDQENEGDTSENFAI
ncbi:hypothetical protein QNK12_09935 [Neobacillus cucumis]|nr:hypothetical protein QNK12_09935 [Neobacillus cucumis]